MAYRVNVSFSDGNTETQYYHSREAAERSENDWYESYSTGGEILAMAGEEYSTSGVEDVEIVEIDDNEIDECDFED